MPVLNVLKDLNQVDKNRFISETSKKLQNSAKLSFFELMRIQHSSADERSFYIFTQKEDDRVPETNRIYFSKSLKSTFMLSTQNRF